MIEALVGLSILGNIIFIIHIVVRTLEQQKRENEKKADELYNLGNRISGVGFDIRLLEESVSSLTNRVERLEPKKEQKK